MIQYVAAKRWLSGHSADDAPLPLWARMVAGASANVLAWAIIFPVDVIKSTQQSMPLQGQALPGNRGYPDRFLECARQVVAEGGGYRSLYRGFGYTMLRAGPVAGVILPFFDISLEAFERFAGEEKA